jgi:hypothetical protein
MACTGSCRDRVLFGATGILNEALCPPNYFNCIQLNSTTQSTAACRRYSADLSTIIHFFNSEQNKLAIAHLQTKGL